VPNNEAFGWAWIFLGLLSGLILGLRFHDADWLGGYGSLRRRLIRLGHVSLVALGMLNVLFATSAPRIHVAPAAFHAASFALVVGAVSMPACCGLMAWRPGLRPLFAIPVLSLLGGVAIVVLGLIRP